MKINNIIEKVIGYILLSPAVYSLFVFGFYHLDIQTGTESGWVRNSYEAWFGAFNSLIIKPEHTNTTVIYFSLMAIAGAYLIKDNKK
jgi:hypothetical protein